MKFIMLGPILMASLIAAVALPQNIIIIAGQAEHQLSETDDVHSKSPETQIPIRLNDGLATCNDRFLPCITSSDCCSDKCLKSPIQPVGNCA